MTLRTIKWYICIYSHSGNVSINREIFKYIEIYMTVIFSSSILIFFCIAQMSL